jgi:hypothetical protein
MPQKSMRVHLEFCSWPKMLVTVAPITDTMATTVVAILKPKQNFMRAIAWQRSLRSLRCEYFSCE